MNVVKRRRSNQGSQPPKKPMKKAIFDPFFCKIKSACGSCSFINEKYDKSLRRKEELGLGILRQLGVNLSSTKILDPKPSPQVFEYRCHAKLAVRPDSDSGKKFSIGLFEPGSHKVIEVDDCPLHSSNIKAAIKALRKHLEDSSITPFSEKTKSGCLRYIAMRSAHTTGELMITFVIADQTKKDVFKNLIRLLKDDGIPVNSAYINYNSEDGNQIFGEKSTPLTVAEKLRDSLCNLSFQVGPLSFFQVNPWQAEQLYRRVEQHLGHSEETVLWDLYCGMGPMSMLAARAGYKVVGIEENPKAVADGIQNSERNRLNANIEFITGRVEDKATEIPNWAKSPQTIIANPSRRGLAHATRGFLKSMLNNGARFRLIYVSCDVESLARDLADLTNSGLKLRQIESFDMFCHTDKLEWVAILNS